MKANNILKIALGFLIVLAFANIVFADEAQDREFAFRAYVAFGKSIDERAVLRYADGSSDEFFIVRNRFEFEKAVEKVKVRLEAKTDFYSGVKFKDPWTGSTISEFNVYSYMEKKARELEAAEKGTVDYYYSQFNEQRSKITLQITLTKDGHAFAADETNLPLVSVVRKSDGVVVKSEQKAAVTYNDLLRDDYEVRLGTLPGYETPASCDVPGATSTDSTFPCAKDYVKKKVGGQISATATKDNEIEVKFPAELESDYRNLESQYTYTAKGFDSPTTTTSTDITTNSIAATVIDADYHKATLTLTSALVATKIYKLEIVKSGNVLATVPVVLGGNNLNSKGLENVNNINEIEKNNNYKLNSVEINPIPANKQIVLNQGSSLDLRAEFSKLEAIKIEKNKALKYDITDVDEIRDWTEDFVWKWVISKKDQATNTYTEISTSKDKDKLTYTFQESGIYVVNLLLWHNGWFTPKYPITTTPISWQIDIIGGSDQLNAKEQEIIAGIDEAARTLELAESYYKKRDKQNALNTLNPVYQKINELKTKINVDLADHIRKDKYLAQLDKNAVTPPASVDGLQQKADVLKKLIDDNLVQKDVGNIITLVNTIMIDPPTPVPTRWNRNKITVTNPTVSTAAPIASFTEQGDVDAIITDLVKKYTIRKMAVDGPVITEEKGIDWKYGDADSITTDIKQITLELFYKDPASNEETKVLTKDWKFGELERIVPNKDFRIKLPDRIVVGQQAEFYVLKDDNSEVAGASNFIWKVSKLGTLVSEIENTNPKLRWTPAQPGDDYLIEVSFDLDGKRVTNVRQKIIVTELANLNVEQLKSAYSASVNDLNAARTYVASVENNPATADVAVLDEHSRKLADAKAIFEQIKGHYNKDAILTQLGIVEGLATTSNTLLWFIAEATRLQTLINNREGALTAAEASRITEIKVEAKSADDSLSLEKIEAATLFPVGSAVYVTAVGYEGTNVVDFKDFNWQIKEGSNNDVVLVTGTDTTTLKNVVVDKNKVSAKVKLKAKDGTKVIIRATKTSDPLVQGETALILVSNFDKITLVNKEIRFVDAVASKDDEKNSKGDPDTKYVKLGSEWFEYKKFTKEYVTELYNKFVLKRRQSAQQFQELLNK